MMHFGHGFGTGISQKAQKNAASIANRSRWAIFGLLPRLAHPGAGLREHHSGDETLRDMTRRFWYGALDLTYL
jgi:hypothetical protein